MAEKFFSNVGPNLYTLPHNVSFVDELASAILTLFGNSPLKLADLTVYLPNRRSVRQLQNSILRKTAGTPTLMPTLIPIGDVSDDEQALSASPQALDKLAPAIPEITRQAILTTQILKVSEGLGLGKIHPAEAVALAKTLCLFLDQTQNENCDLNAIKKLAPDELAIHWQKVLKFLEIVGASWGDLLAKRGFSDPVVFRNFQINQLAENINNSQKPIIAAGSTGSNPATANLLKAIANHSFGAVILPSFDMDMSEQTWEAIELNPTHPQFIMQGLLGHIQASRHEVKAWPFPLHAPDNIAASTERVRFMKEALRPAQTVPGWSELDFNARNVFNGLSYVKCPSPREEAGVIALIMRETLEHEGKTAALVTPDRGLANRVGAELARWDIAVDDSAGTPLHASPPASFIRLLAEAAVVNFSPVELLSLLKHPFAANGSPRMEFLTNVRLLEKLTLRGQKPEAGIEGIKKKLKAHKDEAENKSLHGLLDGLEKTLTPLADTFKNNDTDLEAFVRTLLTTGETLASTPDQVGARVLWAEHDGKALSLFFSELLEACSDFEGILPSDAPALIDALLDGRKITKAFGAHPRLYIWGTLEARLKHADVMILGGLNEGTWPPQIMNDPWMSRPMKSELGFSPAEQRIGQSALDFLGGCGGDRVILTRSEKIDGAPTVPSRWLLRMEALIGELPHGEMWLNWFQTLDRPEKTNPAQPPRPTPPLKARPTKFSVTGVQNWMQNPYSIYAKDILKLRPLDPLNAEPDSRVRGIVTHEAIETFMQAKQGAFKKGDVDTLLEHGRTAFGKFLAQSSVWAFWWPRFVQSAQAFIDVQIARENTHKTVGNEEHGEVILKTKAGDLTLQCEADRLDIAIKTQTLEIIDYKTGGAPSDKQIKAGFAPQLPLEGLVAQKGGFKNIEAKPVSTISYWLIKGGKNAVEIKNKNRLDVEEEINKAEVGLTALYETFQNEKTPYLCRPRPIVVGYDTYDHLARVKEWENEEQNDIETGGQA